MFRSYMPTEGANNEEGGSNMAKVRETRVIDREVNDDTLNEQLSKEKGDSEESSPPIPDPNGDLVATVPLFPDIPLEDVPKIRTIEVHRVHPQEGWVGNIDISTSMEELAERFGGRRLLIKAIGHIGHRYIKQRLIEIGRPPRKPPNDGDEDQNKNGQENNGDMSLIKEGLWDISSKLDGNNKKSMDTSDIVQIALARSDSEREMARLQVEQIKIQNDARIAELEMKQKQDTDRFDKEMEMRRKEMESKLELERKEIEIKMELAKQELELKKAQITAEQERLKAEARESQAKWERQQELEAERRSTELERLEASRKADIERLRQEAKDKEERDRQFYAAQTEAANKFQVLMAQLSKTEKSNPLETLQLIQTIREEFGAGGGEEKEENPMSKLLEIAGPVAMAFASRGAGTPQIQAPLRAQPRQVSRTQIEAQNQTVEQTPAVQQPTEIKTASKRGGRRMATKTATAPEQTAQSVPVWAQALAFCVQHLSIEIIGDAIIELNECEAKVISDQMLKQLTETPEPQLRAYFKTIHVWFDQKAVWERMMEIREYLLTPPDGEEEEDKEAIPSFNFNLPSSGAAMPAAKEEAAAPAPAKEGANVDI